MRRSPAVVLTPCLAALLEDLQRERCPKRCKSRSVVTDLPERLLLCASPVGRILRVDAQLTPVVLLNEPRVFKPDFEMKCKSFLLIEIVSWVGRDELNRRLARLTVLSPYTPLYKAWDRSRAAVCHTGLKYNDLPGLDGHEWVSQPWLPSSAVLTDACYTSRLFRDLPDQSIRSISAYWVRLRH